MILAFDTYYFENKAKTICVSFNHWTTAEPTEVFEEIIEGVAEYEPGSFYKRELPCILSLLKDVKYDNIEAIIIDGFVHLDDEQKLGLGGYLYNALNQSIPIIGVAKSSFYGIEKKVKALTRGDSKKALFITSVGIDLDSAYENIKSMHGKYRMPTILQIVDSKSKGK